MSEMKADLSKLNLAQREQVEMQWRKHNHPSIQVDFPLSGAGDHLKGFEVHEGVWNPLLTSARYYAGYLFHNNERLFAGRDALDIGTGTGIIAVVMGLYGAHSVDATDVSLKAYDNAKANVKKFGLDKKVNIIESDLFRNVHGVYDCIVFGLPYFAGVADPSDTISRSMLDNGGLLHRFLRSASEYLNPGGVIVMPSYDLAGPVNNPVDHAHRYGFDVQTGFRLESDSTTQKGVLEVHELRRKE
jgi:SAM-dependent methyltransferase